MHQRDVCRQNYRVTLRATMIGIAATCMVITTSSVLESQTANASPRAGSVWKGAKAVLPKRSIKLGALASKAPMQLDIDLKPNNSAALATYASGVTTPGSPEFHHYLSPEQFATRFGATSTTIEEVEASLRAKKLTVSGVSSNHLLVRVTGTTSTVEQAFSTPLASYRLADGATGFANSAAPRFSGAGASQVAGVLGLDSLAVASPQFTRIPRVQSTSPATDPQPTPDLVAQLAGPQPSPSCASTISSASTAYPGSLLYSYNEIADAYGYNNLYSAGDLGQGETIALIEFAPYISSDITGFEDCFSTPPTPTITIESVDGGAGTPSATGPVADNGGEVEAELDIDTVASLAPDASIDVYEGPQSFTDSSVLDTYTAAIDNPSVNVISTSWGDCEADTDSGLYNGESTLFEQAATEGKTIVAAAGDDGSEDCYGVLRGRAGEALAVDDPASQPYVTGVGGTYLSSIGPPPTESVWNNNDGSGGAGGGGVSSLWPMPSYQSNAPASLGVVTANSHCSTGSGNCREVPDVSTNAGAAVAIYCTVAVQQICAPGGWTGFGGTSVAAPTWGALFALADASPTCAGTPIGFANPALYAVAGGSGYASAFHDITSGNNDLLGVNGGLYPATPGYNLASGLGTPNAGNGSDSGLVGQLCTIVHPKTATVSVVTPNSSATVPALSRVSPKAGTDRGDTHVTIRGSGFSDVRTVDFGTKQARSFKVDSTTKIVAIAPAGSGLVSVTVTTAGGKTKRAAVARFTYLAAPLLNGVSPNIGPVAGGTTVTLIGSGFSAVQAVDFGTKQARSFKVDSTTKIVAITPAGSGLVSVTVTTSGGTNATSTRNEFRY